MVTTRSELIKSLIEHNSSQTQSNAVCQCIFQLHFALAIQQRANYGERVTWGCCEGSAMEN